MSLEVIAEFCKMNGLWFHIVGPASGNKNGVDNEAPRACVYKGETPAVTDVYTVLLIDKAARFKLAKCEVDEEVTNYRTKVENECKQQEEAVCKTAAVRL